MDVIINIYLKIKDVKIVKNCHQLIFPHFLIHQQINYQYAENVLTEIVQFTMNVKQDQKKKVGVKDTYQIGENFVGKTHCQNMKDSK